MAKAIKQERKVREVVEQEAAVILTLTLEEAQVVMYVISQVGGHPARSRRGLIDEVREAFAASGVNQQSDINNAYRPSDMPADTAFYFRDITA
jgi:hypothetical protein